MHRYRTHTCNDLRTTHIGQRVRLSGWLHNRRDLGGVEFIELRDHYGLTQLVIRPGSAAQETVSKAPKETTICVEGVVVNRGADNVNSELATGDVELEVESVEILGECDPLPFSVFPEREVGEDTRLRYRYLDLRRSKLHQNIILRSKVISSIRRRMIGEGFNEFQTPILTASSPEGARDYLVPSRVHPGKFYALPQAPQMFKQLLMMSGFDRYFQIAPCFRDEDGRADRSPGEFYQLDLEMSFVTQEDVFTVVERVLHGIFEEFSDGRKVTPLPFPRIPFDESMVTYGSDKPDLRNPLKIQDLTELFRDSEFRAFAGKFVRVLPVPALAAKPRAFFDKLEERAKADGAPGLAWLAVQEDLSFKGPIAKFLSADVAKQLMAMTSVKAGDALLFSAGESSHGASKILGSLRNFLGAELTLLDESRFDLCWIVDFPMYERDSQTGKIDFSHNPFSMPQGELEALNTMDPLDIKAFQYDIVCNGIELSSGAIRNHKPEIMYRAFEIAGYTREQVDSRFSGMINALKFGAPPHGGTAPGIDRIVMLLANEPNIREVVAFPMNQKAQDLLMNAPADVRPEQHHELQFRLEMPKL